MRTFRAVLLISILVLMATAVMVTVRLGTAQPAPTAWKVAIGGETPDHAIQVHDYFPRTITVNAGDKITWTKAALLPHTVHFLSGAKPLSVLLPEDGRFLFNPLVRNPQGGQTYDGTGITTSGWLGEEKGLGYSATGYSYSLTFTKPGTYNYVCAIHPGMSGTVVVLPGGAKVPTTQAEYDAAARRQLAQELQVGMRLLASGAPSVRKTSNGTVYEIIIKSSSAVHVSFMRFAPETITVKAGDTVRWETRDAWEPHSVTFAGSEEVPPWYIQEPQSQGPPKVYRNPKAHAPAGGPTYEGQSFYNSGRLNPVIFPGTHTYSLTFTKPGTYTYWCALHVPEGMHGTVVVQ